MPKTRLLFSTIATTMLLVPAARAADTTAPATDKAAPPAAVSSENTKPLPKTVEQAVAPTTKEEAEARRKAHDEALKANREKWKAKALENKLQRSRAQAGNHAPKDAHPASGTTDPDGSAHAAQGEHPATGASIPDADETGKK